MNKLLARAHALAPALTDTRRWLHAHAETGFDLPETYPYVWQRLTALGLTPRRCGRCGIIADVGSGEHAVLLRADMDALPIREATSLPFASANGRMHACGHDLHTAMLLGAAQLLKEREAALPCRVRLMFQPAEELLSGAKDMLEDGLLKGAKVEAAYMLHVLTGLDLPVGTAIVSAPGVSAPAAATFQVRIQGRGCHGAMPHTGVDPITVAAHTVLNLQQIQTRELAMAQSAALTIGMLQSGDTPNVIPDSALLGGSMRAYEDDTMALLLRRTEEIARQTATLFRAEASFELLSSAPTLRNNERLSAQALRTLQGLLGPSRAMLSSQLTGSGARSSGSEDFAAVSHAVPAVMIALAAGRPQDGHAHPAHHPQVTFDEAALPVGASAYAALALGIDVK